LLNGPLGFGSAVAVAHVLGDRVVLPAVVTDAVGDRGLASLLLGVALHSDVARPAVAVVVGVVVLVGIDDDAPQARDLGNRGHGLLRSSSNGAGRRTRARTLAQGA